MNDLQQPQENPFDETYFKTGTYEKVSFARFSQAWWSNRFFAKLAMQYGPREGRVLEVGCGMGHLLSWFPERYQVVGVDVNPWALQEAKQNVPGGEFLQVSAEDLGVFPSACFQILVAKHVVEHLPHPKQAIAEMSRVIASNGLLVLATPNLDSPMRWWKRSRWIGYQDHTHISLKPPSTWLAYLRAEGFQPLKVFSDGFWDAPYLPLLPRSLQRVIFGWPGGLQAILGWSIIPVRMGESLIVLAKKA